MKAVLLFVLFLIASTFAVAPSSIAGEEPNGQKRSFDIPVGAREIETKAKLQNFYGKNVVNTAGSPVRFQSYQGLSYKLALSAILDGLQDNPLNFDDDTDAVQNERFATLNVAVALLAANPITTYISRVALIASLADFDLYIDESDFTTHCGAQPIFTQGTTKGCRGSTSGPGTASDIAVFTDLNTTNDDALQEFVYLTIQLLVANFDVADVKNPLTGLTATASAASDIYMSCFNSLLTKIAGTLPYTAASGTEATNCAVVTWTDRIYQYCYTGSAYQFQKDIPGTYQCNTTEDAPAANRDCDNSCVPDGACGSASKCGFIHCVLDNDYCDWAACISAQPSSTNKDQKCCDLDADTQIYHYCPPLDNPTFVYCQQEGETVNCCDAATGGNCQAAPAAEAGSCFIATAAFGSSMDPNVWALRVFRDNYLQTNTLGRLFVQTYYAVSPAVADVIAQSEVLRAVTRVMLTPIVSLVSAFF